MKQKELNMYKIEVTTEELRIIMQLMALSSGRDLYDEKIGEVLYRKLYYAKPHSVSTRKQRATQKATKVRSDKAKDKINNAINLLQLENKAITHYSIAQTSGVSFNTVKKHIPDIDKIGKL